MLCLIVLAAVVTISRGSQEDIVSSSGSSIVHPGGWHSAADILRMRSQLDREPWKTAYMTFMNDTSLTDNYTPSPQAFVSRDISNATHPANDTGCHQLEQDAMAAYYLALRWIVDPSTSAHLDAAQRVVDSWSGMLKGFGGHDQMLAAGIYGSHFAQAAEIISFARTSRNEEWKLKQRAKDMFLNVFHPVCCYFCGGTTQSVQTCDNGANGNWDASCMSGVISWGVFLDNITMVETVAEYYKNGKGNGRLAHYVYPSGQAQESGRDQAHTQDGLEHLLEVAMTYWHATNSTELLEYEDFRLRTGLEYTAKYNLNMSVPFTPNCNVYHKYCFTKISPIDRGHFAPMWEMAAALYGPSAAVYSTQITNLAGYKPEGFRPPIIHGGAHVGDGSCGQGTLSFYGMELPPYKSINTST